MTTQPTIPGLGRDLTEVHEANNAVIEATKAAAHAHNIAFVLAVVGVTDEAKPAPVIGVESNAGEYELHLSALTLGAMAGRSSARDKRLVERGIAWGKKMYVELFDRGAVHKEEVETAATDERAEGAQVELGAVLRWLRERGHDGIANCLEARDHHTNGGTPDAQTLERRIDILTVLHEVQPLTRTFTEIQRAIEAEPADFCIIGGDLHMLTGLLIETNTGWRIPEGFDDEVVDAGLRVVAARCSR